MKKKEVLWRYIIHEAITHKRLEFTQKDLAARFGFSLCTISNALKIPRALGAIKVTGRNFLVEDKEKFLYLWATHRALGKELLYVTHVPLSVSEIEASVPSSALFGAYSAFNKLYGSVPADYDKVYLYADDETLNEIIQRYPKRKGYENLFVLKKDAYLEPLSARGIVPVEQIFVDIWYLKDWYGKDFISVLRERLLQS